jgi:hypothetical protein
MKVARAGRSPGGAPPAFGPATRIPRAGYADVPWIEGRSSACRPRAAHRCDCRQAGIGRSLPVEALAPDRDGVALALILAKQHRAGLEVATRGGIGAADGVDLRAGAMKGSTALHEVGKTIRVIIVHVREEHCVQLLGPDSELRQTHGGAATRVELQLHRGAVVGIVAVTDQRSGRGQSVSPRPPFGLPDVPAAIHTSRGSCGKARKAQGFMPVRESSGESRL